MTNTEKLIRHLIRCQTDNPEHIYHIAPLTETHELLYAAASDVLGRPAKDIEREVLDQRAKIESYRSLEPRETGLKHRCSKYEDALNAIGYENAADPSSIAREALG